MGDGARVSSAEGGGLRNGGVGTNVLALECGGHTPYITMHTYVHDLHINKNGSLQHTDTTPCNQQARPHIHTVTPHLSVTHILSHHICHQSHSVKHILSRPICHKSNSVKHTSCHTRFVTSHTPCHATSVSLIPCHQTTPVTHARTHTCTHRTVTVKRCLSEQTLTVFIGEVVLAMAYFLRRTLPALASFSFSATSYNRHTRHTK